MNSYLVKKQSWWKRDVDSTGVRVLGGDDRHRVSLYMRHKLTGFARVETRLLGKDVLGVHCPMALCLMVYHLHGKATFTMKAGRASREGEVLSPLTGSWGFKETPSSTTLPPTQGLQAFYRVSA